MAEYVFATAALPAISLDSPLEMGFQEAKTLCQLNLTPHDFAKLRVLFLYYDIENLRALWQKRPLEPFGNLAKKELEEVLITGEELPGYVFDWLEENDTKEKRESHYAELVGRYFAEEGEQAEGFLREFLQFERDWRLIFVGFRAKQLGRDLATELQFEDPQEDLVAQMLAQKDAPEFEPPFRYAELKGLFHEHQEDPVALYRALLEWRFSRILEMLEGNLFGVDRILGYMARLICAEKWMELDAERGEEIVNQMGMEVE